jgi:hypothetical protein
MLLSYPMHACEVHAHGTHAREMHAREMIGFGGCTATGDIAGSCLQVCGQNGSATLPASAADSSRKFCKT